MFTNKLYLQSKTVIPLSDISRICSAVKSMWIRSGLLSKAVCSFIVMRLFFVFIPVNARPNIFHNLYPL